MLAVVESVVTPPTPVYQPSPDFEEYELVEKYEDNFFEEDDMDTQRLKIRRSMWIGTCLGLALIAFFIIVGSIIGAAILLDQPIDIIIPTTPTTTTTTTTTTIYRDPTFNETCITTCNATQGLACDTSGVCLCANTSLHWSYGSQSCATCRSGWYAWYDCCWQYFPQAMGLDWTDAGTFCASQNSVLVTLENVNKFVNLQFAYFVFYVYYMTIQSEAWVNSTSPTPLQFTWYNGNPINPGMFGTGNPSNSGGTPTFQFEGCVAISSLDGFALNDAPCSDLYDAFCEYYT